MRKLPVTIIAALITAIVGPVLVYSLTKGVDRTFQEIPDDRREAVEGRWEGTMDQQWEGEQITYPGQLKIDVDGRVLKGRLNVQLTTKDGKILTASFDMEGGFLHDRFTRFEYASDANGSVHFGSMILELSSNADELRGHFVAFGAHSQKIVNGPIRLKKTG